MEKQDWKELKKQEQNEVALSQKEEAQDLETHQDGLQYL